MSKWFLIGWEALNYLFSRPKVSLGYKNLRGKFENNAFLAKFSTDSSTLTLSLPHILRTIQFFLTFHLYFVYRTWISKNLTNFGSL